jgi:uncharacterized lipoprotein YddW (UPF0748 family)
VIERKATWLTAAQGAAAALVAMLALCVGLQSATAQEIPTPQREFRAAWIATVANIDWPSKKGLSTEQQKTELIALLDKSVALNLNAVILQIRPSADALYASRIEPWSEYLTGTMGRPPKPFYDPLKFAVDEAHKRGLQLHVWFNPYRVRHSDAKTPPAPAHVSSAFPEIVRQYGDYLWFDPGEPESLQRFIDVVTDVVKRYDIDGVHIDDYFYPYPINDKDGKPVPFPDDESYARAMAALEAEGAHGEAAGHGEPAGHGEEAAHGEAAEHAEEPAHAEEAPTHEEEPEHGEAAEQGEEAAHGEEDAHGEPAAKPMMSKDDWRRNNCDRLVEEMYKAVKKEKPWVLVGISPFGIWRPGHPEGIAGLDQYAALYADAKKWLNEGWVDYFTPQLYWQIEGPQSYPKLLAWWNDENTKHRHLWPGNGAHSVRKSADVPAARNAWPAEEVIKQIELTREIVKNGPGNIFFSIKCIFDNRDGLTDKLKAGVYQEPALVPASPWLGDEIPAKPEVSAQKNSQGVALNLKPGDGKPPWLWVVRTRRGDQWTTEIVPGREGRKLIVVEGEAAPEEVAVSAVTRLGREGEVVTAKVE